MTATSVTSGDVTINGNLTVTGTQTIVNTENIASKDPLMVLSSQTTAAATADAGFIVERGTDQNVGIIWDESNDRFALVNTDEAGTTAGDITIASYASLRAQNITVGDVGNSSTIDLETLNKITGITNGVNTADKALVTDANKHIDKMFIGELHIGSTGATNKVDSTVDELNYLNTSSPGVIQNSKSVIYSSAGKINASSLGVTGETTTDTLVATGKISTSTELSVGTSAAIGDISISNGEIKTTAIGKALSLGDNNVTTTGTLSVGGASEISGNLVVAGNLYAPVNSKLADITFANGSITSDSAGLTFGANNISTTGTLASGDTTITGNMSAVSYTHLTLPTKA